MDPKGSYAKKKQKVVPPPTHMATKTGVEGPRVQPAPLVATEQAPGAVGGFSGAAGSGLRLLDPRDIDAVHKIIQDAERANEINPNSAKRLRALSRALCEWETQGLLVMKTPDDDPGTESSASNACLLGWSKLLVTQAAELHRRCSDMIEQDRGGIWKKANGKYNQALKNPTRCVYELFRKIGVKPRFRAAAEGDPGKDDMFYYKEWEFRNDESFKIARMRLATGYSLCPEKGNRERKRVKPDCDGVPSHT